MRIGVPKEIKPAEKRVALTPTGVALLSAEGHEVLIEGEAGVGAGYPNQLYAEAGATIAPQQEVWEGSELVLKVKEPIEQEYPMLRSNLTLFTFLHLAADRALTEALMAKGTYSIAYETIEDEHGNRPLLTPMSEIAGRLGAQAGAYLLQQQEGGKGVLIGGAPGVPPARVLVLGGGAAGGQAARIAMGMRADVTVLEVALNRIRELEKEFDGRARVLMSDPDVIAEEVQRSDVVIGAVLTPGARAARLVRREMLSGLEPGSVLVDIAIDQGGCSETSRPTTHAHPTYCVDGVLHYCVTNMPGAVPSTATRALTNATFPYVRRFANLGVQRAVEADDGLAAGVNVRNGEIVCAPVAAAHDLPLPKRHNGGAASTEHMDETSQALPSRK